MNETKAKTALLELGIREAVADRLISDRLEKNKTAEIETILAQLGVTEVE